MQGSRQLSTHTGKGKVHIHPAPPCTRASDLRFHVTAPLADALDALAETGRTTPCQREPDLWVSDDPQERQEAAYACHMCPLIAPCAAHADATNEQWHVWGGTDRTNTRKKKP